jgi:hypothetical protein
VRGRERRSDFVAEVGPELKLLDSFEKLLVSEAQPEGLYEQSEAIA